MDIKKQYFELVKENLVNVRKEATITTNRKRDWQNALLMLSKKQIVSICI